MHNPEQKTWRRSASDRSLRKDLLTLLKGLAVFAAVVLLCGTETQSGGAKNPPPTAARAVVSVQKSQNVYG